MDTRMIPKRSPNLKHRPSMSIIKPILFLGMLPLIFVGCVSTNPKAAFDDVEKQVHAQTGQHVEWTKEFESKELASEVAKLIQTNLTAQSAVAVALLNNRSLQASFEVIRIS